MGWKGRNRRSPGALDVDPRQGNRKVNLDDESGGRARSNLTMVERPKGRMAMLLILPVQVMKGVNHLTVIFQPSY